MTTETKIQKLGDLYKDMVSCSRDPFAVCENLTLSEMEELLPFARMICGKGDTVMENCITGMRGLLENAVHTASGR